MLDLVKAYLAGTDLPETPEGVLRRSGVNPSAAQKWAANLTLQPKAQEEEEEGDEDEKEMDAGKGNEILIQGPILGAGFDRWIYDLFGWEYTTSAMVRKRMDDIEGDVVFRINSPGGQTDEFGVIAALIADRRKAGDRVDGVVDGMAASAAALIFLLCQDRSMSEFGQVMMHRAWGMFIVVGNQNDIRSAMDGPLSNLMEFDKAQAALIGRVTGKDEEWVIDTMDRELWYGRSSAIETGVATGEHPKDSNAKGDHGDDSRSQSDFAGTASDQGGIDSAPPESGESASRALHRALEVLNLTQ